MPWAAEIVSRLDPGVVALKETVPGLSLREKNYIRGLTSAQRDALASMIVTRSHALANGSSDFKDRIFDRCE